MRLRVVFSLVTLICLQCLGSQLLLAQRAAKGAVFNIPGFGLTARPPDPVGKLAPNPPGIEHGLAGIYIGSSYKDVLRLRKRLPDYISTVRTGDSADDIVQILEPPMGPGKPLNDPAISGISKYSDFVKILGPVLTALHQPIPPKPHVLLQAAGVGPDGQPLPPQEDPDPPVTVTYDKIGSMVFPVTSRMLADYYLSQFGGGGGGGGAAPAAAPAGGGGAAPAGGGGAAPAGGGGGGGWGGAGMGTSIWRWEDDGSTRNPQKPYVTFIAAIITPAGPPATPDTSIKVPFGIKGDPVITTVGDLNNPNSTRPEEEQNRLEGGIQNMVACVCVPNVQAWEYNDDGWKTFVFLNALTHKVISVTVISTDISRVPTYIDENGSERVIEASSHVTFDSLVTSIIDHYRYGWPASGMSKSRGQYFVLDYDSRNVCFTLDKRTRRVVGITVGQAYFPNLPPKDEAMPKPEATPAAGPGAGVGPAPAPPSAPAPGGGIFPPGGVQPPGNFAPLPAGR